MSGDVMGRDGCVFCQIVAGEAPALIVREWPDALAIRPLEPVTKEHLLVLPKTHVEELGSDPWIAAMVMHRVADLVANPRRLWDYNVITSAGSAATQTVFHLHVHVVPRRKSDGLMLPWSNQKPADSPCQGRCEFHGRLWCKDTGRSCQEFVDELEARSAPPVRGKIGEYENRPRPVVLTDTAAAHSQPGPGGSE